MRPRPGAVICGICGIVGPAPDATRLRAMVASLHHRGPDDSDMFVEESVGLGHTRLSIVDLSPTGHQPMWSADGSVVMVYNGELYNQHELRLELEALGCRFRGRSDSEVLLEAYARWGVAVLRRLNGMFAVAFWHPTERKLVLARDRFGIKPLYFAQRGRRLVFGSEIKALLASGEVAPELRREALHEYLYYGVAMGNRTMVRSVERLGPGHTLTWTAEQTRIERYWSPSDVRPIEVGIDEATSTVRAHLDAAVRDHLMSDVPVGLFLSGGIDSSAIAVLAARHYPGRLKTFTAGFDFAGGTDELPRAAKLARELGTEHHELRIRGSDLPSVLERLVRCHDEPFPDAANIPLYLLCEALNGSVKVVLQGDGGDEIFAGYPRYAVLERLRRWQAAAHLRRLVPARGSRGRRLARLLEAIAQPEAALRMAALMSWDRLGAPTELLTTAARAEIANHDPFARYREVARDVADLDPVQQMLYTDVQIHLPEIFLEKVDKPTMAHGIEVRVPYLDARLASYGMALPSSLKVHRGHKKVVLRRALRGVVSDAILDAPKTGFDVPYSYWLRTSLAAFLRDAVLDPAFLVWIGFDRSVIERHIAEHTGGARDHGFLLYKVLQLALWRATYRVGG